MLFRCLKTSNLFRSVLVRPRVDPKAKDSTDAPVLFLGEIPRQKASLKKQNQASSSLSSSSYVLKVW